MQQRQLRPGDVVDDYCPRERRVTDHAIVAMVGNDVQRTRCVVCDAEHEFKNARVPAPRRKPGTSALFAQVLDSLEAGPGRLATPPTGPGDADLPVLPEVEVVDAAPPNPSPEASADPLPSAVSDDRPFRRSLIRAQLPRPEGQPPPPRAIPEFTMHQPPPSRGKRPGGGRFRRRHGQGVDFGTGPMRFGRDHGHGQGQGQGQGQGGHRRRRRKKH
jgi:hypothetical protein